MDTPEAIERAAEIGMLLGQDLADARALALGPVWPHVRSLMHDRIADIVATWDNHDPGLLDGVYRCPPPCGFQGNEQEWERHLADKLADALAGE